jgi:hypothetical protein
VALGSKGLVLLASLDRLVAWLSVYTRERSLEDLITSLSIEWLRSKLGTQEIALTIAAESSDRMDRVAETARLVGGFTFTGTSRHFVQYRDAAAPFGYDAEQLLSTEGALALYHDRFTQVYNTEKSIDLRSLLLTLMPHLDPSTHLLEGSRYIVAESGLGPALIHYLVRSQVEADVSLIEWPCEDLSAEDDSPVRRYLFRVPKLPARMRQLLHHTPGLSVFLPAGVGVAVEVGVRHPVALRACPVFNPEGLALVRSGRLFPWTIERLPVWGDIRALSRVEVAMDIAEIKSNSGSGSGKHTAQSSVQGNAEPMVRVALRLVPSGPANKRITASYLSAADTPLLRRIAYALPTSALMETHIAVTSAGVFLRNEHGIDGIPLGMFAAEIHPGLFMPAGYDFLPKVAPEVLYRAMNIPSGMVLFILADGRALAVEASAFFPLHTLVLESPNWEPLLANALERTLTDVPIELRVESLGLLPMRDVKPALPIADAGDA